MNNKDSVNYCGSYCGECALSPEFTALRNAAIILDEIIVTHGLQSWVPDAWLPEAENKFDFAEFRKGLAFFSNPESFFVCKITCKEGGGHPECIMRKCCQARGLDVCFDCDDFPCKKVEWNPGMIERGEEYKKLGKDEWLRQQEKEAKQGYEVYAGKYYRVWAGENPPDS